MCNGDRELCVQKASKFFAIAVQDTIEIRIWLLQHSGFGSVASQAGAKEGKLATGKQENQKKEFSPNNSASAQETVDGRKAFESWLFEKLPFITSTELQVWGEKEK